MRRFHLSARRAAAEAPPPPPPASPDPEVKELIEKIRNHTGATEAMWNLKRVFDGKGLDLTKQPSAFQMMRLAADKEVRSAIQTLVEEFQKAGVTVDMKNMQAMFAEFRASQ